MYICFFTLSLCAVMDQVKLVRYWLAKLRLLTLKQSVKSSLPAPDAQHWSPPPSTEPLYPVNRDWEVFPYYPIQWEVSICMDVDVKSQVSLSSLVCLLAFLWDSLTRAASAGMVAVEQATGSPENNGVFWPGMLSLLLPACEGVSCLAWLQG